MPTKKFTEKSDDQADRKFKIKEGSGRDSALDKKRGVPEMPSKAPMKMPPKMPMKMPSKMPMKKSK